MTNKKEQIDYKNLQAELDQILESLQDDSLDIDEAIKCYERGLIIVHELEVYLKQSENTVRELQAKFNLDG